MKRAARFVLGLSFLTALPGCVATQRDILDMEGQMDTLQVEIVKLRQTLEGVQRNQADLVVKLEDMDRNLGTFNESLSSYRDDVGAMSARMDDLRAALEHGFTELAASTAAAAAPPSPSDLFREASGHQTAGELDLALRGFELYLEQNPEGSLADQAQYRIGEVHSAAGAWRKAAFAYAKVLEKHPKSDLTPAARLRYALSLLKLDPKMADEAERYLESVVHDFPGSPEAGKAAERLAELKKKADKAPTGKKGKKGKKAK